ncbi:Hypothetical predicted protein, partial [Cloeon dipterum]
SGSANGSDASSLMRADVDLMTSAFLDPTPVVSSAFSSALSAVAMMATRVVGCTVDPWQPLWSPQAFSQRFVIVLLGGLLLDVPAAATVYWVASFSSIATAF